MPRWLPYTPFLWARQTVVEDMVRLVWLSVTSVLHTQKNHYYLKWPAHLKVVIGWPANLKVVIEWPDHLKSGSSSTPETNSSASMALFTHVCTFQFLCPYSDGVHSHLQHHTHSSPVEQSPLCTYRYPSYSFPVRLHRECSQYKLHNVSLVLLVTWS